MRAGLWYSKDCVSERETEGGEFNMAESSVGVGRVDCLFERGLEEARPN